MTTKDEALRAENERLRAALTPSAETKAAYSGEFGFNREVYDTASGDYVNEQLTVPWATIKDIMAAIRARATLNEGGSDDR